MIKLLSVVRMLRVPLLTVSAFTAAYFCVAQNQSDKFTYPAHLPYRFANFVWWTDNQLRAELAKRVPGLGDEIATTHAAEAKMRDALTALLKEKGVVAEVQSEEPGPSAFIKPKGSNILDSPIEGKNTYDVLKRPYMSLK